MTHPPLIAVVDDEEMVRKALSRVLETANYEAAVFASGEEFLDWLKDHTPACVVLDFNMPGMDGQEVHRRLIREKPQVPVIVLTAHDYPDVRQRFLDDGAKAFLHKPWQREVLLKLLTAVLNREW